MHMAKRKSPLNAQIVEEATAWFIDFNDAQVDRAGEEEFGAWLRRSPEHVQAFLQVSAFWEDAETLSQRPGLDIDALIARAKAERNVFPLEMAAREKVQSARERPQGRRIALAAAAMLLLAIGTGLVAWQTFYRSPTYATETGEQRSITLEDGSSVTLNSRSRIKLKFTAGERALELIEGQALFKVAKDSARPFVVSTGDTRVRAVGTQFDVYRKRTGTVVTVIEGRVAVARNLEITMLAPAPPASLKGGLGAGPGELLVAAGEQTIVTEAAAEPAKAANVANVTAWTDKRLVFDSTPLREVVEEFNRYNRQQLVIRDPELYDFHISGVFPSTDSARVVEFLRQRFGVRASASGDEIEISRRARR
jgi:transmembrane sensor